MEKSGESYKQYIPALNLSIERNTQNTPVDGKFYVLREGRVLRDFTSLKKAQECFRELVRQSGYTPPPPQKQQVDPEKEHIERFMEAKELYWAESHRYRGRGGKGGRGGV